MAGYEPSRRRRVVLLNTGLLFQSKYAGICWIDEGWNSPHTCFARGTFKVRRPFGGLLIAYGVKIALNIHKRISYYQLMRILCTFVSVEGILFRLYLYVSNRILKNIFCLLGQKCGPFCYGNNRTRCLNKPFSSKKMKRNGWKHYVT